MAPRPEKVAAVEQVEQQLTGSAATLLTDYRGLSVPEIQELRAELRKADATYVVVKNTLTRIAARNAGFDGLDELLTGPTALVFCGEDPVGPAKALKAFAKDHEALVVKGGYLDGEVLDAAAAAGLAELASREELLATLVGMMDNALAGFARLLAAAPSQMARLMGALEADGGVEAKGFAPEAPADDAPAAEAEEAPADADADESAVDAAAGTVAEVADEAADAVAETAEQVAETAAETVEDAAETAAEVAQDAAEAVSDAADAVAEAVTDDDSSASTDEPSDDEDE